MARRHAHSAWSRIKPLNPWVLLALGLFSGLICIYAMRQNNLTMVRLRNDVFVADKANGDVETALRELRSYIYSHMNTNLSSGNSVKPPIQLKYRYERLVKAEKERVSKGNDKVYNDAQKYCERTQPQGFYGASRLPCVRKYVSTHGTNLKEQPISDAMYKFDFVSPAWTPDLAGLSMVFTVLFLLLFGIRLGLEKWVKHDLSNK